MPGNSVISQPLVTLNILPAQTTISNTPHRVLLIGQKTSVGTAVSGALNEQLPNDNSEDTLFGADSMLAGMVRAFKRLNKVSRVDAIALSDNGAGVAATSTIVVTGPATAAGSLTVVVGSDKDHTYTVAVASGDTATVIGGNIETAINADTKVPVTAANFTGTVTLTAVNKGPVGNDLTVKVSGTVAGVSYSTTAAASGATAPVLTGLFDVCGTNRYQTIVWPYQYTLTEVKSFLDGRFNADNIVLDGVAITTATDTYANLVSAGNLLNSQSIAVEGFKTISDTAFKGSSMLELGVKVSASLAAIRALRFTQDASIARYVIATSGARDSFGGAALASFPYFNTPIPNLPLIPTGKGWDNSEIEGLLTAGVSTIGNNVAGNTVISGELATTYKTDSAGNSDVSFKFLPYVDTASNIREFFFNNLKARFAQSRLTTGDVIEGRAMANEGVIRAFCKGLYQLLSGPDYVLVQAGEAALNYFNDNMVITIDMALGKVTLNMKTPMVTQLRDIIGSVQISFTAEG